MKQEIYDQIVSLINEIKNNNQTYRCGIRNFEKSIYGLRILQIYYRNNDDLENFNLGSCMTLDTILPDYKFFKFEDMYDELCNIYNECGFDFKKIPLEYSMGSIFKVLASNSKYYRTLFGSKRQLRYCLFIFDGWQYLNDLNLLSQKFKERDIEDAKALNNYYNSKLTAACLRIEKSLDHN